MGTAESDITTLQNLYNSLQQSAPQVIQPTDTWPVANPSTTVIYRVIDRTNTPPQYYSDYMWNGTAMVLMATYNNAVDNVPTENSNNLVKSGGVFNCFNGRLYEFNIDPNNPVVMVDGASYSGDAISRTTRIEVKEGDTFEYKLANAANGYIITAFDANGDRVKDRCIIGNLSVVKGTYLVTSGVKYIQACNRESISTIKLLKVQSLYDGQHDANYMFANGIDIQHGFNTFSDNPIVMVNGDQYTGDSVSRTFKIGVKKGDVFLYKLYNHANTYSIIAYDNNGNVLQNVSLVGAEKLVEDKFIIPDGVSFIQACNWPALSASYSLKKLGLVDGMRSLASELKDINDDNVIYVAKTGNDTNEGNIDSPVLTINEALSRTKGDSSTILISEGDYRETINPNLINSNKTSIRAIDETSIVRILGSEQVTIEATEYANIYKATVPSMPVVTYTQNIYKVYVLGINSHQIEADEAYPQMCGAKYRLPFLRFFHFPSVFADVSSLSDAIDILSDHLDDEYMYYDISDNKVYIASRENLTSKKLEVYSRPVLNKYTKNNARIIDVEFENIDFYFSKETLTENEWGFNSVIMKSCKFYSFTYSNAPWFGTYNRYNFCESADAGMDGFASAMDTSLSELSKSLFTIYNNCWGHDNYDDGYSHHRRGRVIHNGCLSSYNVNEGFVYANGSQAEFYGCIAYKNGGHGFSAVAGSDDGRINTSILCVDCISEQNASGYEGQDAIAMDILLRLISCKSIDNPIGYYIKGGNVHGIKMICINCTTENDTVSKKIDNGTQEDMIVINTGDALT